MGRRFKRFLKCKGKTGSGSSKAQEDVRLAKQLTVDSFDDLFDYLSQFEKLVNASRAKKLEKSHDPLALFDYNEEYEQDDVHNHSEDPLASAMLLLAKAITQNFSNLTNNRLRASSNTRNQAVIQGDRVNIQSRNSGLLELPTPGNTSTVKCYNYGGKGHYARNCPKPRVRDSKYFMEQILLAKQEMKPGGNLPLSRRFLFADASRMEKLKNLYKTICLMLRIQPADQIPNDDAKL
ncbi:retrovirus-related pol polyprotein from transposon TNT 1-94 [Tanacetum coccineum]